MHAAIFKILLSAGNPRETAGNPRETAGNPRETIVKPILRAASSKFTEHSAYVVRNRAGSNALPLLSELCIRPFYNVLRLSPPRGISRVGVASGFNLCFKGVL